MFLREYRDSRALRDRDDGKTYYEGDVYYDNKEYEFEIDAATGQVTDWSEEAMGR